VKKRTSHNILTRNEILDHLSSARPIENRLFISPLLEPSQIGDTSIDLRLGHWFLVPESSRLAVLDLIDLHHEGRGILRDNYREVRVPYGEYFTLHPRASVKIGAVEYLSIPVDLQGIVTLRASVSDIPIIANAAQVHPGHKGIVALTLTSNAEFPIKLYPGVRIAELQLQYVDIPIAKPRVSRYHGMTRPGPTKLYEDRDLEYVGPTVEPITIGIVSTIAAGRTTAVGHLVERYGFGWFSLANILKSEADRLGIPTLRTRLQDLGRDLRKSGGGAILATRLRAGRKWLASTSSMVVVDSFKHVAEAEEFRKQKRFKLLGIDAPTELRWERVERRRRQGDPMTREEFLRQDAIDKGADGDPHGQQVASLLKMADEVIYNDGTTQEFLDRVDRFVVNLLYPSATPDE
jgi:dCTP deaminase